MKEDTMRLLRMYELMVLTRKYDELLIRLFKENKIPGFIHSGQGQEAIPVGACFDLREDDFVLIHHRGFGHCLTKGLDPERLAAEMCGKATGYSHGKGGFHVADLSKGILGISGSLGACFPLSVGAGLTAQYRKTGQVAVCFFGDGTANRELFHPSMNLAKIWKLPVVFVCENNRWAITVPIEKSTASARISENAKAHDIPGVTVDGNDVLAVNEAMSEAIKRARQGRGPSLVECTTFRWRPHAEGYPYFGAEKEGEEGQKHCPIQLARKLLLRAKVSQEELDGVESRVGERMQKTYEFAVNSPFPEPEKAWEGLYDGRVR
jgi:acetoin:2,6-dichlorophenolindophenol oxidoreductase subunit alpha